MKKILVMEAIQRIYPSYYGGYIDTTPEFNWDNIKLESGDASLIDKDLVEAEISEISIELAHKILRSQRNQLLQQTDWRMTKDYPYADQLDWEDYRFELRELPQRIENGEVPAPTLDENGMLVFDEWPLKPGETE